MRKIAVVSLALIASAAVVTATACTENGDNPLAPSATKKVNVPMKSVGILTAGMLQVCIDPSSPAMQYAFFGGSVVNAQTGDVATTPVSINTAQPGPVCKAMLERPQSPTNLSIATVAIGAFAYVPDGQGGYSVMPGTWTWTCDTGGGGAGICTAGPSGTTYVSAGGENSAHGAIVTFTFIPRGLEPPRPCVLDYPFGTTGRPAVAFNESEVLAASEYDDASQSVRVWYTDEHALTLGVRSSVLKGVTTDYPFSGMTGKTVPQTATGNLLLNVGLPYMVNNLPAAVDGFGRPIFPAVFVTDITNASTSNSGDWQQGGVPVAPSAIYGTWKGGVLTGTTKNNVTSWALKIDNDPAKNNLITGGDTSPISFKNQGYSAEVVFSASSLGLLRLHTYRLQFMVHDGDQNKAGGDVGEACLNVAIP